MKRPRSTGMSVFSASRRTDVFSRGPGHAVTRVGRRCVYNPVRSAALPKRACSRASSSTTWLAWSAVSGCKRVGELAVVDGEVLEHEDESAGKRIERGSVRRRHARSAPARAPGRSASRSRARMPTSPIRRVAAVSAAILTNTDSGTPSPVRASRARDDVPASPPITDTDVTVRPMICDSESSVEIADRPGERAHAADGQVGRDPLHSRGRDARPARRRVATRPAVCGTADLLVLVCSHGKLYKVARQL